MRNTTVFIEEFGELFTDMQLRQVLEDQKTFVDSEPRLPAPEILERYRWEKELPGFGLKAFFDRYFDLPPRQESQAAGGIPLDEYIALTWDALTRRSSGTYSTLIALPAPFIVPGGRFREIFYWDSYFTMLGLQVAGRTEAIEGMVRNFAFLIDSFGFIPNGNRTYFLSRSQPPFFSLMLELLGDFSRYLPQLEKEYAYWMQGAERLSDTVQACAHVVRLPGGEVLNRYWDERDTPRPEGYKADLELAGRGNGPDLAGRGLDPAARGNGLGAPLFRHLRAGAESGWDFSSRWLRDGRSLRSIHTTDLVPVDLNCLLLHLERTLETACAEKGQAARAEGYGRLAAQREATIQRYLWDPLLGCFADYDLTVEACSPWVSAAMVYPLFFGVATEPQAARTAALLESRFLQPGGLLTTLLHTGLQWDAPNGWAPLQWMACQGLRRYGREGLAASIRRNWMGTVEQGYARTGKLREKYNVVDRILGAVDGEYPNQDGFGWTNGVYAHFKYTG